MTVSNNEYIRASARQTGVSGQDVIGVFMWRCQFAADQTESAVLAAVLAQVDAAYVYLNAVLSQNYNPLDIKVDVVAIVAGKIEVVRNVGSIAWTGSFNPAGNTDDLPPGACGYVKLLTDTGKTYGRKFISGLLETRSVSGFIDATAQTALASFAARVVTYYIMSAGNELHPGVLSIRSLSFKDFTSAVVSSIVAYQRRRKFGVGS